MMTTENLLLDFNDRKERVLTRKGGNNNNNDNYHGKLSLNVDILNKIDVNNNSGDSGLEEDDDEASPQVELQDIAVENEQDQDVKLKKERKSFSMKRRPSIWKIFRSSTRIPKKNLNYDSNGKQEKTKEKLRYTTSCPMVHSNRFLENDHHHDSSQTSDLGDSIPSTPVSTISSTGLIEIPGLIGMHNLGNTCYFNAIVQCLAHIDIFSEYFAMDHFFNDLNNINKQSSSSRTLADKKKKGVNNGCLTEKISLIIKSIWNSNLYSLDLLQEVMDVICKYNNQYNVYEQQDALEFFMWLIDKIHEESVKIPKKKHKELKKKKSQCNEERAVAAFASFTQYSQSYTQGLFLSQYQSSIPCSSCNKHSSTFDPYTSLSLDIPPQPKTVIFVTVVYRSTSREIHPLKFGFHLQRKATIHELRTELTDQAGLDHFILVEINSNGMRKILLDDNPLSILPKIEDCVYAVECGEELVMKNEKREDEILLVVSNVEKWGKENRRFGLPTVSKVSTNFAFKQLQTCVRKKIEVNVRNSLTKLIKEKQVRLGLRVITEEAEKTTLFLNNELDCPLAEAEIKKCFVFDDALQMRCLYLVAEWEPLVSGWFMNNHRYPSALEDVSCAEMRARQHQPFVVDLEECLRLQTQEEKLPENDVWRCPFCRTEQFGITKKLTLWSLPDILVLHLKRFDQVQQFNGKVTTHVRFPTKGLNLSPYVATTTNKITDRYRKQSIKLQYQPPPQTEDDCMYNLKAVCNHLGTNLNRGHYTSYCHNSVNDSWYLYDDCFVKYVPEDQIETSSAYLLFYERRKLSSRIPDQLSVSGFNTKALEHWSLRMKTSSQREMEMLETNFGKEINNNDGNDSSSNVLLQITPTSQQNGRKLQLPPMLHAVQIEDNEEY